MQSKVFKQNIDTKKLKIKIVLNEVRKEHKIKRQKYYELDGFMRKKMGCAQERTSKKKLKMRI